MKNLILVRHGEYHRQGSEELTDSGIEAVASLGKIIASKVRGSFYLASSGVKRADQSAEVLRKVLGVERAVEVLPCLDYQERYLEEADADAIFRTIWRKQDIADNLILVTHVGVVNNFPNAYMKALNWGNIFAENVDKAWAVNLDHKKRTYEVLIPKYSNLDNSPKEHQFTKEDDLAWQRHLDPFNFKGRR